MTNMLTRNDETGQILRVSKIKCSCGAMFYATLKSIRKTRPVLVGMLVQGVI